MKSGPHGLSIIFHSGFFDRIYHGLSIAITAQAMGSQTKFFFTYWALKYLQKTKKDLQDLVEGDKLHKEIIEKQKSKGHITEIPGLLKQAKAMGAKLYICTNSMALLNISRDEVIDEVDKSMGLATFLDESREDQLLFI